MQKIVADLDWFRVVLISTLTGGGGFGLFKLFRLFNSDFLAPYRSEMGDLRDRADAAEAKANKAADEVAQMRTALYECQAREQRLRLDLIRAGINIPHEDEDPNA